MRALTLHCTALEDAMLPRHEAPEVAGRIEIMLEQEVSSTYKTTDYLKANVALRKLSAKPVDEDCRVKMCEWCYQVVDFCKFRRETVGIGMSYLDRYLCSPKGRKALSDRKEYQLVAMTCLYVAIKLHEPLEMETSLLADLSRGCYTEMEFANMEQTILEALLWRVSGPTSLGFVQHYLIHLLDTITHPAVATAVFDYARYQTELAVADHAFVSIRPSIVAMAAVLNAMEGMDTATLLPHSVQKDFVRAVLRDVPALDLSVVEATQTKLSMLLISLLSEEQGKSLDLALDAIDLEEDDDYEVDYYNVEEEEEEEEEEEDPVNRARKSSYSRRTASPVSFRK